MRRNGQSRQRASDDARDQLAETGPFTNFQSLAMGVLNQFCHVRLPTLNSRPARLRLQSRLSSDHVRTDSHTRCLCAPPRGWTLPTWRVPTSDRLVIAAAGIQVDTIVCAIEYVVTWALELTTRVNPRLNDWPEPAPAQSAALIATEPLRIDAYADIALDDVVAWACQLAEIVTCDRNCVSVLCQRDIGRRSKAHSRKPGGDKVFHSCLHKVVVIPNHLRVPK
jgi:hypothetical protein